jgi:hypothetical protein
MWGVLIQLRMKRAGFQLFHKFIGNEDWAKRGRTSRWC